ncbi:hypothetical protein FS837_012039 [Tulasnella sp. UAMH 9824]|nr:hypothetical protein FS837_012039 [Tulasnella sp. UAMH 9824]
MSDSFNKKTQLSRFTRAQETIDGGDDVRQRLRIFPKKVLESLSHLRIHTDRIEPIEGQAPKAGGQADVEAAILLSAHSSGSSERDKSDYVAVKKLRFEEDTDDDRALAPLAHEVNLLNDLSHDNVVKIVGFVEDVGQRVAWMLFAWEKNGNLREFIRSAKWELPERIFLIDNVAKGLAYLHGRNPPICHGDLKSLNILVNSENRAVITDFGSARAVDSVGEGPSKLVHEVEPMHKLQAQEVEAPTAEISSSGELITMTGPAWTVRWAAPELLGGHVSGLASDVWALGWICWEAVTGNFPFDNDDNVLAIVRITKGDLPPVENDDQLKHIQALCSLMRECWKLDPSERPTAVKCQQLISWMDQATPSYREGSSLLATRSSGLLYALGHNQLRNSMLTEAREYFEQSFEVADSVGDEGGKGRALNAIGYTTYLQDEYSRAEESYIQARSICSQIGDHLGFAQSVDGLGDVYRMRSEYSKAEESYIQARDMYSQIGDRLGFAQSVDSLGDVYRIRGAYSDAEESYTQACDIYSEIGDRLGLARSIKGMGDVSHMRDEYSKAEGLYIQARDIYAQMGNQLGFAQTLDSLADVYRMRNEYSKAEESFIQARDIYSEIGDQLGFAQSVKGLGDVYHIRNEDSRAEQSYIQALDIYSQLGDKLGFAQSVKSLGDVYRMRDEYSKAEELYIQARDIYAENASQGGFAQSLASLGEVYRMRDEYTRAEESYVQARDIYSQIGDQLGLAQSIKGLGDVYLMRGDGSKAEELFIQARDIYFQIGDQLGVAQSFRGIGNVHSAREQYAMARESYLEAQEIYHRTGNLRGLANIAWDLGCLHRKQGQYGKAESLVREASRLYSGLGLNQRVKMCGEFLEDIHPLIEG